MSEQPLTNPPVPVAHSPVAPVPAEPVAIADAAFPAERCLNCEAALTGEYCAHCGQHSKHHVHSTVAMIGEFIEDLFHTDHRVWRTIKPLLTRPGMLTVEYLRGRRVTYTPPFRLYIVLSLIYFFTASLSSKDDVNVILAHPSKPGEAQHYDLDPNAKATLEDFLTRLDREDRAQVRSRMEAAMRELPPEGQRSAVTSMYNPCVPDVLGKALPENLPNRAKFMDVCRKVTQHQGKDFMEELKHHVPQMMFFFLPLIALWAKFLYIGSKRYYAEHLLFFVHFHAFFFLIMAINNLLGWMLRWFGSGFDTVASLLTTSVWIYGPIYLYRALRRVYGQSGFVTATKYMLLLGGYAGNMLVSFGIIAAYTAMTLK